MTRLHGGRALACTLALLAAALPARAHDTWWAPQADTERGERVLALGTGNRFPVQDSTIPLQQVAQSGCVADDARRTWPLRWMADRPDALLLRTTRPVPATVALSCWAQMTPVEVRIDKPEVVATYLAEIHATPAVRARWATLQAQGQPWLETFTKHARTELTPALAAAAPGTGVAVTHVASGTGPTPAIPGLGLDVQLDSPRPLRAGDTLRAQVLRDGQPLAGQAIELRSDLSPLGLWRTTDAQGRFEITLPLAARWLLRGVDLRPSAQNPAQWDSRFLTLAFEVLPRLAP
jgi:hypothetical protein